MLLLAQPDLAVRVLLLLVHRVGDVQLLLLLPEDGQQVLVLDLLQRPLLRRPLLRPPDGLVLGGGGQVVLLVGAEGGAEWGGGYMGSLSCAGALSSSPMALANFCMKEEPRMVVTMTMMSVMVMISFLCSVSMWKQRAKAMTPRMMPEYQQIFSSFAERMNFLLKSRQKSGRMNTMMARTMGRLTRMRTAMRRAAHSLSMLSTDAPRQVNTKASAMQLTVSKASPVPFCASSEMFMKEQWPMMMAQVKSVMMPERPISSPMRQVRQPLSRMRLVSLMGCLLIDSQVLKRQLRPNPLRVPKATLKKNRQQNSRLISTTTLKVSSPPMTSSLSLETVPKRMMATASLRMPSPKSTALSTGNFSALMRELAATVSVAQRTLLSTSTSVRVSTSKRLLTRERQAARRRKPMTVPTMPRKLMTPKFSKKRDLRREQPAEKMMGGSMTAKKRSLEKLICLPRAYLEMSAVTMPMRMAMEDSWVQGTRRFSMMWEVRTQTMRMTTKMKASTWKVSLLIHIQYQRMRSLLRQGPSGYSRSFSISRSYSLELLSLATTAFARLRSRYPPCATAFSAPLASMVTTRMRSVILRLVQRLSTSSSPSSSSIEGFGRFSVALLKLCSTDHSSSPLNSSSSRKLKGGEDILPPLITEMPEMERPSLATDCESESSSLDSSAMKATLSSLRESEQQSSRQAGGGVFSCFSPSFAQKCPCIPFP